MKVTKEMFVSIHADYSDWFLNQNTDDSNELLNIIIKSNNKDLYLYAIRFLSKDLNKANNMKYAVFAAKEVLHIFENRCPNNSIPRNCIETIEDYLKNPTEEKRIRLITAGDDAINAGERYWDNNPVYSATISAHDAAYTTYYINCEIDKVERSDPYYIDAFGLYAHNAVYQAYRALDVELVKHMVMYGKTLLDEQKGN